MQMVFRRATYAERPIGGFMLMRLSFVVAFVLIAIGGCGGPVVLLPGGALEGSTVATPDSWTQGLEWAPQLLRPSDLDHFDFALVHAPAPLAARLLEQEERLRPVTPTAPWRGPVSPIPCGPKPTGSPRSRPSIRSLPR